MGNQKFKWVELAVIGLIIGVFLLKGHVKYALIITLVAIIGNLIVKFLDYINNRAEHDKHVINVLMSQTALEREFYFNRILYLQDRLSGIPAPEAHGINTVPTPPPPQELNEIFFDSPVLDGLKLERVPGL